MAAPARLQTQHGSWRALPLLTRLAAAFLLLLAGWLAVLGLFNLRHPSDWAMGDWLINYSGGFVRRGLIGQGALLLRNRLHLPLLWSVLLLQWALYAVVLGGVWRLVRPLRWSWWLAAIVFSPATLAFVLQDPPFAFRKELLLFALLTLTLAAGGATRRRREIVVVALLTIGCAVCVLAHEALVVFFPYLFAAVWLRCRDWRRAAALFALPALITAVLFAVVSRFPGDGEVAWTVCSSIGGHLTVPPSGICGGAIDYLMRGATYAHHEVQRTVLQRAFWPHVPFLFVLPLLPAALGLAALWRQDGVTARRLLLCAVAAWGLSISVFYYGTDWTRWVYIHCFCLMLLMLFAEGRRQAEMAEVGADPSLRSRLGAVLLLLYCLSWQLTMYQPRPLYGSFMRYLTHTLQHPGP